MVKYNIHTYICLQTEYIENIFKILFRFLYIVLLVCCSFAFDLQTVLCIFIDSGIGLDRNLSELKINNRSKALTKLLVCRGHKA